MFKNGRISISLVIMWLPFIAIANLGSNPSSELILVYPMFATIPALIMALTVFSRVEKFCDQNGEGYLKYLLVPISGGVGILVFMLAMSATNLLGSGLDTANGSSAPWEGIAALFVGSFAWGILWLVTGDVMKWLGVESH